MAIKRMFSLDVVDTDTFMDMPPTSQNLYFHLGMRADDDGFVATPKRIINAIGSKAADLDLLIEKGFLIPFDDGVIVITHWRRNNTIQSDRHKKTVYEKDMAQLTEKNGVYSKNSMFPENADTMDTRSGDTMETQYAATMETQNRVDKIRLDIDKESVREKTPPSDSLRLFEDLRTNYDFSEKLTESLRSWVRYKSERRESYKSQGMKSLLSQVSKHAAESGDEAVCNLIEMCMSNGWKGIIWERLPKTEQKGDDDDAEDWTDTDNFYKRYLGDDD